MKLNKITRETTVDQLMNDSLVGKERNIYNKEGLVIGTVKIRLSSELWLEEQKQMLGKEK